MLNSKQSEIITRSIANKRRRSLNDSQNQKQTLTNKNKQDLTADNLYFTGNSKEFENLLQNFINYWRTFDRKSLQNEIKSCTNELSKQHNLVVKLIDLNKQLQNLLKSDPKANDLDLIFEAINGELQNLQTSAQTQTATPTSAQIIENFFNNFNKILNNFKEPLQVVDYLNDTKLKQEEIIKKLKLENKNLKDLINDANRKEKKQNGGDSELIRHLSAKVSKTLAVNSNLNNKLKTALSEIESLKKLVISYRNGALNTSASGQKTRLLTEHFSGNSKKRQISFDEDENDIDYFLNTNNVLNDDDQLNEDDDDDDDQDEDDDGDDDNLINFENDHVDDVDTNGDEAEEDEEVDDDHNKNGDLNEIDVHNDENASQQEQDEDGDEEPNYYSYFNLTENNYGNVNSTLNTVRTPVKLQQQQQQQQQQLNISDFISRFYNKKTNTIYALPDYINTEDVVLKMREFMQKFKINQRDAGERIIGVKKSHVSFLLSNLKTWDMLTRKGKEPYTRMFLFFYNVNDDGQDNAKKYFNQTYQLPKIDLKITKLQQQSNSAANKSNSVPAANVNNNETASPVAVESTNATQDASFDGSLLNTDVDLSELEHIIIPYDITSVAENESFDTIDLTERIKEILKANKISQELFCRAVLNLSDRILCKPKTWNQLGKKAREHYIRMHLFLNDPFRFEKLNDWKEKHFNDKKWRPKKRKSSIADQNGGQNELNNESNINLLEIEDNNNIEMNSETTEQPQQNIVTATTNLENKNIKLEY